MAFSDWAGNSLAGKFGTSNFHIKWLIDDEGNVYKPENSSSYYWNTDQALGKGTPVNIAVYSGDGNISGDYETNIHMPLKQYNTILYSSTGSLNTNYLQPGFYTTMSFEGNKNIINNKESLFNLEVFENGQNINSGTPVTASFGNIITDQSQGWSISNNIFTFYSSSLLLANISSSFEIDNVGISPTNVTVKLYKNNTVVNTLGPTSINGGESSFFYNNYTYNPISGDKLYITVESDSENISIVSGERFYISSITGSNNVLLPYFTLDNSQLILTASSTLSSFYGGGYNQIPVTSSGFPTPLPFVLQQYDQIRFEGNEDKVYTIMNITSGSNNVYITLDKPNSSISTNINNFSIRRLVNDAGFIMIDNNPQQQTGTAPSFIIPKYASKKLKSNLNNIIQNLYQKNLI
jgi:hypothetical protein